MADSQRRLALEKERERGADLRGKCGRVKDNARTLPSIASSSIVRRPTSCPCLSPDTSSSPWSSSRKSSDEPSRVRTGGSAVLAGEDLGGRVIGRIITASWSVARRATGDNVTCKAENKVVASVASVASVEFFFIRTLALSQKARSLPHPRRFSSTFDEQIRNSVSELINAKESSPASDKVYLGKVPSKTK